MGVENKEEEEEHQIGVVPDRRAIAADMDCGEPLAQQQGALPRNVGSEPSEAAPCLDASPSCGFPAPHFPSAKACDRTNW